MFYSIYNIIAPTLNSEAVEFSSDDLAETSILHTVSDIRILQYHTQSLQNDIISLARWNTIHCIVHTILTHILVNSIFILSVHCPHLR